MDIEKAINIIKKSRLGSKDPELHEVFQVITWLIHEVSIARSENALLTQRVEDLEADIG